MAITAIIGVATLLLRWRADTKALNQRTEADNRAEWWRRAQWAIDHANNYEDEAAGEAGLFVLIDLLDSDLAQETETRLLDEVGSNIIDHLQPPRSEDPK